MLRAGGLLQQAAEAGHYVAARNLVFMTRDRRLPTYSPTLAGKYHRHATALWQAPWKTFMAMADTALKPLGFRKRESLFWRRCDVLHVIEVLKSRWNCDFDIRLGRGNSLDLIPKHIEECHENLLMRDIVTVGEVWDYTCGFQDPEIRVEEMKQLLEVMTTRAIPWLEEVTPEPNPTSDGIRQPADGAPKP